MPLKSKAEGRFLNAKFGHAWVIKHHFGGSQKGLPQHVKKYQRGTASIPGIIQSKPPAPPKMPAAKPAPGFAAESGFTAKPPKPEVPYYPMRRYQKGTASVPVPKVNMMKLHANRNAVK